MSKTFKKKKAQSKPKAKKVIKKKVTKKNKVTKKKTATGKKTESTSSLKKKLKLTQEKFCKLYTSMDREMFGNGTQSYIEAYGINLFKKGAYQAARACASENLTKPNIISRISELLEEGGFNDSNVEKQHLFLLNQYGDLKTKMKAIENFYKLKGKFAPEEVEITYPKMSQKKYDRIIQREARRIERNK